MSMTVDTQRLSAGAALSAVLCLLVQALQQQQDDMQRNDCAGFVTGP